MVKNHRVPFKISYLDHGYSEVIGLFHVKKEELVLEFEQNSQFTEGTGSGLQEIFLPLAEIESVQYRKKWIGAVIEIEARSMRLLKEVPGAEQGHCELKIKRKHRKAAEHAVSTARVLISEHRLKELEE